MGEAGNLVLGLLVGGLITVLTQHWLAARERSHDVLKQIAAALGASESVLSGIDPQRWFWGGPKDWWPALTEQLDEWRLARRELTVASYLVGEDVSQSVRALILATSLAANESAMLISMSQDHADGVPKQRNIAIAAHSKAVEQHTSTSDLVRQKVTAPAVPLLRRLSSGPAA